MDTTRAEVAALATSAFVPDARSDMPSPFASKPWAAYAEYLGRIDPGGQWWQQMKPGAKGYGLFVAFHNSYICCNSVSGYHASYTETGIPILVPALVEWASIIGPDGYLDPLVAAEFQEDLDFPPVAITNAWWLDDGELMPYVNLVHEEDYCGPQESWFHVPTIDETIQGLAAPWQVLPITQGAFEASREFLLTMAEKWHTYSLSYTNCHLNEAAEDHSDEARPSWMLDDDEWHEHLEQIYRPAQETFTFRETGRCVYEFGTDYCSCGRPPTEVQEYVALMDVLRDEVWSTESLFLPQPMWPAWRLALSNYRRGWTAVFARKELGDSWSSFSWRRLSPFSGSRSLEEQPHPSSTASPSSATPPASSPESSQQLMLFAS